jgi:hypothetical protein
MNSKPTIIALSGWKRSGKDTAAAYLIEKYGAERVAFADPLKTLVGELFGLYRSDMELADRKENPLINFPVVHSDAFTANVNGFMSGEFKPIKGLAHWTPRALCILIGSTMRAVDPNYWVKQAVAKTQPGGLYVISDLRYRSEIHALMRENADVIPVRINRFDASPSNDPSERDLDNYNFPCVMNNKGSLEDLYMRLDALMEELRG